MYLKYLLFPLRGNGPYLIYCLQVTMIALVNLFAIVVLAADNSSDLQFPHTRSYRKYDDRGDQTSFANQMYVEKLSPVCNNLGKQ